MLRRKSVVDVVWSGSCLGSGDSAVDMRSLLAGLDDSGFVVHADPADDRWTVRLSNGSAERLERLVGRERPKRYVHVVQGAGPPDPTAERAIARVVDPAMISGARLASFDEVWVHGSRARESLAASGVPSEKIYVVHPCVDTRSFDPLPPPLPLRVDGFAFFAAIDRERPESWRALVRVFLEEFAPDERATLVLSGNEGRAKLDAFVRDELGHEPSDRVRVIGPGPAEDTVARFYAAASAFVTSHDDARARPCLEAMATGVPTIGNHTDFMTDENSYVVADETELRAAMRRVFAERGEAAARAERGRRDVLEHFTRERAAAAIVDRLDAAGFTVRRRSGAARRHHRVTWEGPQFVTFGMANVNRSLTRALVGTQRVDLELRAERVRRIDAPEFATLTTLARRRTAQIADVYVRHAWPPDFSPPPSGRLVVVQPWEWGSLPRHWLDPLERVVDEVWVPSHHVRNAFVASGVDGARVAVVPNGIDPLRFRAGVEPLELPTRKRFRFLFVGGTLWRKGADTLLRTYLDTFGPDDDVCLVVKDLGSDTFYRGQTLRETFERLQQRDDVPEILYLGREIAEANMPRLYAAADCLVHPYRAEGFALPVAESMACGTPAIVPELGACRDYCDADVAYLVPAEWRSAPHARFADFETVAPPRWIEIDRAALAETMRTVASTADEARERGASASDRIRRTLTWNDAADVALARLDELVARKPRRGTRTKQLTVCMIVRNEETSLARALESVRAVADEIVVVDTGSTDGTVDVARRHGALVYETRWDDDFATARNESLRHATKDWILVLDADQELARESRATLRALIQSDAFVAYMPRQLNYLGDGDFDTVEHLDARLFPNDESLRYVGRVHEQIVSSDPERKLESVPCDVVVHHYGTRSYDRRKAVRDSRILEAALREDPTDAFAAANLGTAYLVLGAYEPAERAFRQAIALESRPNGAGLVRSYVLTAYIGLARSQLARRLYADERDSARRALQLAPEYTDARLALGDAELRLGNAGEALTEYLRAARTATGTAWAPTDRSTWKAELGAAEAFVRLGDLAAAADALARAESAAPGHPLVTRARARLAAQGVS